MQEMGHRENALQRCLSWLEGQAGRNGETVKQNKMKKNKQLTINMIANFINFGISLCISFFLSPYIVRTIGVEANGFITLANNFVSYTSLITIALNSMTGRFVTISLTEDSTEDANKYFTSALFANVSIAIVLGIIGTFIVVFLKSIINVPDHLLLDVQILFSLLFINCLIGVVGSIFGVAAFARNKLYLEYLRTALGSVARALVILCGFLLFSPHVWYVGLGGLVSGIIIIFCDIHYTKKLLPEIRIRKKYFCMPYILTLIKSGIWNTVNKLGQLLADGLDLLITNLFIDATAMGVLSLAKTVPNLIYSLMGSVVGVFTPDFTILYAQKRFDELVAEVKQSMKIMGVVTNLPVIILIVCGRDFFRLWQPTQDPQVLQLLSILTVACLIFSGSVNCLYNIFTVVNKLKRNSVVVLIHGAVSTVLVFLLLKWTSLGIYAVAGVSTSLGIIRILAFTVPYGAMCLGQKWYVFYGDVFKPVLFAVLTSVVCLSLLRAYPGGSWLLLCGKGLITATISILIGYYIILSKKERKIISSRIFGKIRK